MIGDGVECPTCQGFACDEGCGQCEHAYAGPDSHRVCRTCRGAGVIDPCPVVVGQQHGPGPGLFITCGAPHAVADHPPASDDSEGLC